MAEITQEALEPPRKLPFDWLLGALIRPRKTFAAIAAQTRPVWLLPMVVFTITALARVLSNGWVRQISAMSGNIQLPPDFQYYSPEQQAQYMQAMQATSGPVFVYIFPALMALAAIWLGWLLVGGALHLVFTMVGGRGETITSINLVAWASLPFALREVVRAIALLSTRQMIDQPGLSGFVAADATGLMAYIGAFLALVDIYLIWHIALLYLGARQGVGISAGKALISVLATMLLVLGLQALMAFALAQLGNLTVVRPFFF